MALETILDLLQALPAVPGPFGAVSAALLLARTIVRRLSLVWLTRGAAPGERALILAALRRSPRPPRRGRVRRLVRRWRRRG
ncbi:MULTISPECIES: hypothetical protein [Streptomyces]|uniref:Uncharacterized protein n=2 Tax=Streptomyces TaxID=1883 RepID=A0A1D8G849_9ACTN|nr:MULTISPECIES: hypothetical protein [Streptomyces]AOT61635.1 hypothetical protein A4G23_04523 [Streptomyces rubrolavendulae]KAF0647657.1 hypothetical protein K701_22115 [Streptomyces fradiae ATCC 10745 = DSM 40063]KAF0650558.1 hypothetical protein K701_08265 [Streptomyces fradiae ATCC 10745 = DSM 40063]OSY54237.1 hypothetical protein BG846_00084 [Streptomyces fradiae ATCC 10745 = DSM 40063]QEV14587.1 hypothetical protein CP974_24315 [Streptomyces fradiae ATCC 10745 = DSM 40063]